MELVKKVFSRYNISMLDHYEVNLLNRFARILAAQGYDRGLQPVQWQALGFLKAANRFSRTAKGLTAWLGQTKGSVSQTLIALEGKGLITREADHVDARVVRLHLTSAGRSLVEGPQTSLPQRMLSHLSSDDQKRFTGLVQAMLLAEVQKSGGKQFGLCRDCRHFERDQGEQKGQHYCNLLRVALSESDSEEICVEQEASLANVR